ncbi:hypothetical protein [Streptomyces sp. C3-3]|uniref:hypothetical protein n=1 Tax=Streptomyces sp. C3-3 TaxID=2824901 RepID=UPI001B35F669|nr:hypothetical protein [Streptomyces sp. C3-3]MBQ1116993.1 hypothetical protein [Streptomyces sp. C3-3]
MNPTGPQDHTQTLLLLLLAAILGLVFAGLAYVTYQHPALAVPLTVATGGALALLSAFGFVLSRR